MAPIPKLGMADWLRRVSKDLSELIHNDSGCYLVTNHAEDLTKIEVMLNGQPDSPFEGGAYELVLTVPRNYPHNPPKAHFVTTLFHPNISCAGTICVDILEREKWSCGTSLVQVVEALSALLNMPFPDSPLNPDAGSMLINNPDMYTETVKAYAHVFAGAPNNSSPEFMQKIAQVECFTNCSRERALMRLATNDWVVEACYRQTTRY